MNPDVPIRTVERLSPSAKTETLAVLRFGALVIFAAWAAIGIRVKAGEANPTADLLPFQVLFRDIDAPAQRVFRQVQEGDVEAERIRGESKAWPEVAALAAQAIPPFAIDPVDRAHYRWRYVRDGAYVNYRGVPDAPNAPEFLLLIQEPEAGTIDPLAGAGVTDETHHKLSDGTLLHVTVWFRARSARTQGAAATPAPTPAGPSAILVDRPFAEGWTQILAGAVAPRIEGT